MNTMLLSLGIALILSLLIQFVLVYGFVRCLQGWKRDLIGDNDCPEAVVILCLRGGDPFLSKCIEGLIAQDYPRFRVCFMIDHANDPAMQVLRETLASHAFDRYDIHSLANPLNTCSLKCSSLVQAVGGLPATTQFIALLDADTIPHRSWLRELATALQPESVGAATGNRWYMPNELSDGALIRYVWNAAAVVQMYWYRIAWGGTLAIKTDTIRQAKLIDRWSHAFCEDTMLRHQLSEIGQRVEFVPSLMMINREDCTVGSFYGWVQRQLLTAKLYHPLWYAVVGHGFSSAGLLLWGWATAAYFLMRQDWLIALSVAAAMIAFQIALSLLLPWMESAVQPIVRARGESCDWNAQLTRRRFAWSVWATQWVYTWALTTCLFVRRVSWRGVEYDVHGSWKIHLLAYRPLQSDEPNRATLQSL